MKNFKIKSFSKVNLSLRVVKKLKNNYHNIISLITFSDPHDIISISEVNGSKDKISFSGKFKKGIQLKNNTITKALYLLRKKKLLKNQSFQINIKKNIPHGAGLGGGSSNAANILNFFNKKIGFKLKKKNIIRLAEKIGFDVQINLERKNTFLNGKKGEMLRLGKKFKLDLLIVYPNIICSTKKIYSKNKKISSMKSYPAFNMQNKRKLIDYLSEETNDLQDAVIKIYPKIGKLIDYIKSQKGCRFSRITGSGSTCIGIFSNKRNAINAQRMVKLKYPKYWCAVSKTI